MITFDSTKLALPGNTYGAFNVVFLTSTKGNAWATGAATWVEPLLVPVLTTCKIVVLEEAVPPIATALPDPVAEPAVVAVVVTTLRDEFDEAIPESIDEGALEPTDTKPVREQFVKRTPMTKPEIPKTNACCVRIRMIFFNMMIPPMMLECK